jgi:antitoxin component of MazEF toxin-antitoxin module
MLVDATIQRIGGSTFARLPPAVVKKLGLHPGDKVQLSVMKEGITGNELAKRLAKMAPMEVDPDWRLYRGPSSKYD